MPARRIRSIRFAGALFAVVAALSATSVASAASLPSGGNTGGAQDRCLCPVA